MTSPGVAEGGEADAARDWAWRRRIRANPPLHAVYRVFVFLAGLAVVVVGILLVPLPGPGWVIVFLGLAIWASEFRTAQRLLGFVRTKVREWSAWTSRQRPWVRLLVVLATAAVVVAVIWGTLWVSGVPTFLPDGLQGWLATHLDLD